MYLRLIQIFGKINFNDMKQEWSIEEFKEYCRRKIDENYWITPSMIALKSFCSADVKKPEGVTIRMFELLRSTAEKEIQIYKQKL